MSRQFIPILIMLLLLLALLSPFSALAGLMLLVAGSLIYGLAVALFQAFLEPAEVNQTDPD